MDGGGISLIDSSNLHDDGNQPTSRNNLTVRDNMAHSSHGGGIAFSADSTVNLAATVVTISHNIAEHRGGGLFVDASLHKQSNATSCGVEKVVFWRFDLVDNTARNGDGGAIFSASKINL